MSDKNFCAAEDETRQRRREEGPTLFLLFSLFLIHFMGFICRIEVPVFHQITAWESESGVTDCDTCQVLILQKYKVMTVLFAESIGSEACCRLVCCLLVRRSQWSFCVLVQHYSSFYAAHKSRFHLIWLCYISLSEFHFAQKQSWCSDRRGDRRVHAWRHCLDCECFSVSESNR